jgi:putative transposase
MAVPRKVFDIEGHSHFLTFSCYHRLPLLSRDRCKQIVLGHMNLWSGKHGVGIVGYVVMPDHVHALVRPIAAGRLSTFMQSWKGKSSVDVHEFLKLGSPDDTTPFADRARDENGNVHVWTQKYHGFNVFTLKKALEKLEYMHNNPVRAGYVDDPCAWSWSSAAHFLQGKRCPVRLVPVDGPLPSWLK